MIDELAIYNLAAKYPNTVDLVREIEKMARAEALEGYRRWIKDSPECDDRPCDGMCIDCYIKTMLETQCEDLEEHDAKIRADAIDEFVAFANTMPIVEDDDGEIRPMRLEEMAEQLKEKK